MATPLMGLTLPTVSVTEGPEWANQLNTAITTIDAHDHSTGKGAKITPLGLNINTDLSISSNNLTSIKSARFSNQSSALNGASDIRSLYVYNNNLYYNNESGTAVQITSGNEVFAGSIGGFTAQRAIVSNNFGILTASSVTSTELGYLSGVTSAVQTQLNSILSGTANHVLVRNGSGTLSSEAQLAISRGGTGQSTATAAFDALAPTTSKGDIIVHNGSDNIRVAVGTDGQFLKADSGQTSGVVWASASTNLSVTTKTASYTATTADDLILCNSSGGAFTITLPTAVGNTGKRFWIRKISTGANVVTVDGDGSQTIDGTTTYSLVAPGESITIVSDGSNWYSVDKINSGYFGSLTTTGSWSTNTTYTGLYWKRADRLFGYVKVATSGLPTSANLTITLPNSWQVDTNKLVFDGGDNAYVVGRVSIRDNNVPTTFFGGAAADSTAPTIIRPFKIDDTAGGVQIEAITQTTPMTFASGDSVIIQFEVPISGW